MLAGAVTVIGGFVNEDRVSDLFAGGLAVLVLDVSFAIGFGGEAEVAQGAFERFLPSVGPHVPGQGAFVVGVVGAIAHVADVRRSIHVFLVVAFQGSQVGEDGVTKPAGELSLELHVPDQVVVFISVGFRIVMIDVIDAAGCSQLFDGGELGSGGC